MKSAVAQPHERVLSVIFSRPPVEFQQGHGSREVPRLVTWRKLVQAQSYSTPDPLRLVCITQAIHKLLYLREAGTGSPVGKCCHILENMASTFHMEQEYLEQRSGLRYIVLLFSG